MECTFGLIPYSVPFRSGSVGSYSTAGLPVASAGSTGSSGDERAEGTQWVSAP